MDLMLYFLLEIFDFQNTLRCYVEEIGNGCSQICRRRRIISAFYCVWAQMDRKEANISKLAKSRLCILT